MLFCISKYYENEMILVTLIADSTSVISFLKVEFLSHVILSYYRIFSFKWKRGQDILFMCLLALTLSAGIKWATQNTIQSTVNFFESLFEYQYVLFVCCACVTGKKFIICKNQTRFNEVKTMKIYETAAFSQYYNHK